MYYSFSLMEGLLAQSRIALNNALQYPELKARLLEFGVDENRIQEGLSLRAEAEKLLDNKTFRYGEQIGSTAELNKKIEFAYRRYMNFLKLARFAVKDNIEYQRSLGTIGPRLMSLSGWMRQARQFYENAINNDDILQLLSRFSITKEKLQEGLDLLPEIEALDNEQESKKGLAIKSTRERDEAFDKLNAYMTEFRTVCRIAFEDEPQTLERLGIPVKTSNYKGRNNNTENDTEPDDTENNPSE